MDSKTFNLIVDTQLGLCKQTLTAKGEEYAPYTDEDNFKEQSDGQLVINTDALTDRLHAFKRAAVLMNTTPKGALMGMLSKHLVSVSDMCIDNKLYSIDKWNEKITDSMCYLILLRAIVEEELYNAEHRSENSDSD